MTSQAISPDLFHLQNIALQNTKEVSKAASLLPFVPGENLNALVVGHPSPHTVRLQIKNTTMTADSQIPLQVGEKLTVRVDQIVPSIVLKVINRTEDETLISSGFIKYFRSNPQALKELFDLAKDFFGGEKLTELSGHISSKDTLTIANLMDKIIISKANVTNPLFLKESVAALGLTFERGLMQNLLAPLLPTEEKSDPTMKEVLLKMSSDLKSTELTGDLAKTGVQQKIEQLSGFVDQALRVIESLQIVNVLAREQDQLFAFQIPFQFPGGIRMQDIFIETEARGNEQNKGKRYRVVLFVDMDALGELAVDAGVNEGKLRCTIKCQNREVRDFITALLPELQEKLASVGYAESALQCNLERELPSWKQDFLANYRLFSQSAIDLTA